MLSSILFSLGPAPVSAEPCAHTWHQPQHSRCRLSVPAPWPHVPMQLYKPNTPHVPCPHYVQGDLTASPSQPGSVGRAQRGTCGRAGVRQRTSTSPGFRGLVRNPGTSQLWVPRVLATLGGGSGTHQAAAPWSCLSGPSYA